MATTVHDLMRTFSPPSLDVDTESTLSSKPWTNEFAEFEHRYVRRWPPTIESIESFLGPAKGVPSSADFVGLQTPANHLNALPEIISSEGDVTRDFDQNIAPPVALAFSGKSAMTSPSPHSAPQPGAPALWSRSLNGPLGSVSSSKVIDYQMTMEHPIKSLELAAMIGEMKAPRVIKAKEWLFERPASSVTRRLQQELRAYAYEYQCPQVFVFDTKSLVILQFHASNHGDIANEDCPIDCCVIPRRIDPYIENQCTMLLFLEELTRTLKTNALCSMRCIDLPGEDGFAYLQHWNRKRQGPETLYGHEKVYAYMDMNGNMCTGQGSQCGLIEMAADTLITHLDTGVNLSTDFLRGGMAH